MRFLIFFVLRYFKFSLFFAAQQEGAFADEIAPLEIQVKRKTVTFDTDEHPRPGVTIEALSKLPPVFKKNGTVSAGNASVSGYRAVF